MAARSEWHAPLHAVPTTPAVTRQSSWSEWGAWSECSAQCGGGFQWRRRQCHSPKGRDGCGGGCESDYRACNTHACSEKRRSSNWTSWMRVNATREGHFEQRFRFTCRANVADDNLLHMGSIKKEERYCHETSKSCMDAGQSGSLPEEGRNCEGRNRKVGCTKVARRSGLTDAVTTVRDHIVGLVIPPVVIRRICFKGGQILFFQARRGGYAIFFFLDELPQLAKHQSPLVVSLFRAC